MSDSAIRYLNDSGGFEVGAGPSVVVLDAGTEGLGLQGTKISRIDP